MPRVVSLIASATEIVCALGHEADLVGRSHECDFPSTIGELPVCTEPKFDVEGSSREIDQRVKSILEDATSVYRVHSDLLKSLQPDVIVTQAQCDVCAVSLKDVEQALCSWLDSRPEVVSLQPNTLDDVFDDIQRVAKSLGDEQAGTELCQSSRNRIKSIAVRSAKLGTRPTVACIEWIDPLMAAGNWMPELVELAGGKNVAGEHGKHSPWLKWETLCELDPEIIIAIPCGFDLQRTQSEMAVLQERSEWSNLQAVRNRRVYVTDGNQYFNRSGPRLVESLEILAEIIHGNAFSFNHEGIGWQDYSIV